MAHRRAFRTSGLRRKKLWANLDFTQPGENVAISGFTPADVVAPGGSVSAIFFSANAAPAITESTILRIRGYIDVPKSTSSSIQSAASSTAFAFGIGLITDEAALVASAIPNPASITGADWDGWMFLRSSTQIPVDVQGTMLDVRAKRKFQSGMSLVFVAGMETSKVGGDVGQAFFGSFRGLFLLP